MSSIHVIVCIKQVPDPEAPISGYRVDSDARKVVTSGVPPVISPFDENALELALRLKDTHGVRVTALSAGDHLSPAVLKKALFAGADELILVETAAEETDAFDSLQTALALAEAIKKTGRFDIILTGRQASDTNAGMVGIYLAEFLHVAAVTLASRISLEGEKIHIERSLPNGTEEIEAALPVLLTAGSEAGELRSLDMRSIKEARKKPIQKWSSAALSSPRRKQNGLVLRSLTAPKLERKCFIVEGATPAEAGEKLAVKLKEDKVL
ncbi:MAG: electron transfer flavoprotein beta subunit/FixA family protein [Candidatus Abyssobacteria bacterium SURF_5]|uniref:Electron transfer flavoprotein beta subunit/FixA family protein n=1 Tax=Abyssobacteria bacterium (strain SURF_5) TaxID=2093360 RepID=A0A3A4N1E0_ABYX5|nr:MAG: electron transfer flavoprotein beta subunit/FixA family protein [Candidatus Abyssubacteria bacterium SURF_5]